MPKLLIIVVLVALHACAGRSYRTYPENGSISYLDCSVGAVGGKLDATGVTMHYKGQLKDTVNDLGAVEAKVSKARVTKSDVLRELQLQAQKKNADGIYDVLVTVDGETMEASGMAFKFKQ